VTHPKEEWDCFVAVHWVSRLLAGQCIGDRFMHEDFLTELLSMKQIMNYFFVPIGDDGKSVKHIGFSVGNALRHVSI
jgi:hypothetical protein